MCSAPLTCGITCCQPAVITKHAPGSRYEALQTRRSRRFPGGHCRDHRRVSKSARGEIRVRATPDVTRSWPDAPLDSFHAAACLAFHPRQEVAMTPALGAGPAGSHSQVTGGFFLGRRGPVRARQPSPAPAGGDPGENVVGGRTRGVLDRQRATCEPSFVAERPTATQNAAGSPCRGWLEAGLAPPQACRGPRYHEGTAWRRSGSSMTGGEVQRQARATTAP